MQKSSIKKLAGVTVAVIVGASFASFDVKAAEQELRSNLVFGPSESSGDQIGLCYLDTVFELYSGYHLGQIIEAA